jgi:serine/threonine-protein kinase
MASVYAGRLASMAGFERLVAIKIIHKELAEDPAFIKMFLDEARIVAGIHHPNVGEILEVGEDDGLYFMVGELVQGQSLRSFYRRAKLAEVEIDYSVAAHIGAQICFGAHAAHELRGQDGKALNLIHRDISPRNILVSYSGFTKLIDFGVAWAKGRDGDSKEEALKGKLGFMSPEQVRGEPPMDRRSDLFSLGIVLYLMLAGEHPFLGRTAVERLNKLIRGLVTPLRLIRPDLDPALEKIVHTALAPKMEDRFESAQQMGQELENYTRKIGANVGSETLAGLMKRLFSKEMTDREQVLRDFREQQEKVKSAAPVKKEKPSFVEVGSDVAEDVTEVTESVWKRHRLMWIGGAAAAVVVTIFLLVMASDNTPENATLGSAPIDGQPEFNRSKFGIRFQPEEKGPVRITLDIHPTTASVVLDAKDLKPGTRELELPADGASHELKFSAEGYIERIEQVVADKDTKISIYLHPVPKVRKSTKPKRRRAASPKSDPKLKRSPYD